MSVTTTGIYLLCVLLETCEQVLFRLAGERPLWRGRAITGGILLYLCELVCWYWLLSYWPLGIALPLMGLNYVTVALAGSRLFAERLTVRRVVSIALIICGVTIICIGAGDIL